MRLRRGRLTLLAAVLACAGALALGAYFYNRPTLLRIAVARDSEDHKLVFAIAHTLSSARKGIKLRIVPTEGAAAASAALDAGEADLAVARSDIGLPAKGQAIVVLHRNAVLLLARDKDMTSISALRGAKIALVKGPHTGAGNQKLLETIFAQYDLPADAATILNLPRLEAISAFRKGEADALMLVGSVVSDWIADSISAATPAGAQPNFLPVAEARAIALRHPALESVEVFRGAFGGAPPRPAANFDTLGVSVLLTGSENLKDSLVADLARAIFSERVAIAKLAPLANQIAAPDTDKDAALPVHTGAAAYYGDEEQTFFDKYSDLIYIGAMLLSVLGSAAAALASRMYAGERNETDTRLERLIAMLRAARCALTHSELDALEEEADSILVAGVTTRRQAGGDAHSFSALALALDQVRFAIEARRRALPPPTL